MNLAAVQHMAYDNFCYPYSKDELVITIKTGKDISSVFIIEGDPFSGGIMGGDWKWSGKRSSIIEKKELQRHFFWSICVKPEFKRSKYYFELHSSCGEVFYFLEGGFYSPDDFKNIKGMIPAFVFPWMNESDINRIPAWASDTIWYQIFPERFCNGNKAINASSVKEWGSLNQTVSNDDDFGGDLQGIINKLDYLEDLGITGIYLNPLNYSESKHKYDTIDYLKIDPLFGDEGKMRELSQKAHKKGIKIMFDGVFNHSGWEFFAWQDVLEKGADSQYADWFMISDYSFLTECTQRNGKGYLICDKSCGGYAKGNKYYAFAFVDNMPKLNTNNPEVIHYLLYVCEMWVKKYDIDALRLDVANEISHTFCKLLKQKMLSLKSDFYIVGEIWHNSLPWLRGDEFDSVMNYPLSESIMSFWKDEKASIKKLIYGVNNCYSLYMKQTNKVLFNLMDSHDTARLITLCNDKKKTLQQFSFMFAMSGSACLYYGTEILLEGFHDPDCRRCMPWKEIMEGHNKDVLMFFKKLIALRKSHEALRVGDLSFIEHEDNPRLVHIKKVSQKDCIELYCNCSSNPISVSSEGETLLSFDFDGLVLKAGGMLFTTCH